MLIGVHRTELIHLLTHRECGLKVLIQLDNSQLLNFKNLFGIRTKRRPSFESYQNYDLVTHRRMEGTMVPLNLFLLLYFVNPYDGQLRSEHSSILILQQF